MAPPHPPHSAPESAAADENEGSHTLPGQEHEEEDADYDFTPKPQWWSGQEDIVISGMSGRMPESDNMKEFMDNLYNGVDMITEDNRRWEPGFYDLPTRHGKIKELRKFDAGFFGVHPKQAANMDPQLRLLLETSYEAMVDAGVNPQTLRGSNCGVFVANAGSETSSVLTNDPETVVGYSLTGCVRSMMANRISYTYDFRGPSFAVDTACSGALLAFQLAVDAIRQGQCDSALVCGAHVTLTPNSALQFLRLTMLSPDGKCQSFDAKGNGYVRSECVGAIFLQRESAAKRCYANVVHAKSNTDGYKEQGITFPSGAQQRRLLLDTYKEAGLDPRKVIYVEAHGTGTKIGDPQECSAVTSVFCRDRTGPLLIGSVKSNAGHAEPASGIMSLAKVVFALETGVIPQNLHFQEPNPNITGLLDGRLKVVSKNTPWEPGYVGVSSFGFGGSNTHIILKPATKRVCNTKFENSQVPVLHLAPGRTAKGAENLLKTFEQDKQNVQLYDFLCEQSSIPTNLCPYRGFSVTYPYGKRVVPENLITDDDQEPGYDVQRVPSMGKRPIILVYSGMGSQWAGMGRELMCIDIFRESVLACSRAIEPFGISPLKLITEGTDDDFKDNTLHCFLGICAIQIGLTDLLRHLGLQEDGIIGHSTGEMASSYADGCTTREETMLIAYYRGKTILGAKFPPGAMAAIGLSWEQTLKRLPPAVFPACHNAPDSVTVSGDATKVAEFVKQMQQEGVFVKTVNSSGIAFHSPCMQIIAHEMREYLAKLLPNPKPRSKKWVSSSVPDDKLGTDLAKYSSADYHVNNMVSSVLFYSALRKLPENAIVIEVAPHCLLQAILKRGMPGGCQTFGLMSAKSQNNVEYLLQSLGKIYQAGANLSVQKLYPRASYPVPRGTPMLGPLLDWDHSQTWDVFTGPMKTLNCVCSYTIDPFSNDSKEQYVLDHVIDGRVLYPFTGYLVLAWKALCKLRGLDWQKTPITIENVNCFRATIITKPIKLDVCVTLANGYFEILEDDSITCTGYIHLSEEAGKKPFFYEHINEYPEVPEDDGIRLVTADLYKEFQLRGYEYGPHFRGVLEAKNTGTSAELAWTGNWVTFIDTLLQTNLIYEKGDTLKVPVRLRYLRIDPARQAEAVREKDGKTFILARNHFPTLGCVGGGVEACDLACQSVPKRSQNQNVTLERIYYTPYFDQNCLDDFPDVRKDLHTYNDFCRQLAVEGIRRMLKSGDDLNDCRAIFEKISHINEKVPAVDPKLLLQILNDDDNKCQLAKVIARHFRLTPKTAKANGVVPNGVLPKGDGVALDSEVDKTGAGTVIAQKVVIAENERRIKTLLAELERDKLWNFCWNDRPAKDCLDVCVENTAGHFMRVAAVEPVSPFVLKWLRSMHLTHPLLEGEYTLIGPDVEIMDQDMINDCKLQKFEYDMDKNGKIAESYKNQDVIICDRILHRKLDIPRYLAKCKEFLRDDGFIIVNEITSNFETAFSIAAACGQHLIAANLNGSRKFGLFYDDAYWSKLFADCGFRIVAKKADGDLMTSLYLLHKIGDAGALQPTVVKIDDVKEFEWVEPLQKAIDERLNEPQEKTIWLLSNETKDNGAVGLSLCLREENNKNRIRCIADVSLKKRDETKTLKLEDSQVQEVMKNDLLLNVYRDGVWGTIKHLVVRDEQQYSYVETQHAFINTLVRGDLSSLAWVEGCNKYFDYMENILPTESLCQIYYASLNFRDIMLATGRLAPDAIPIDSYDRDCLLGMEYVGRLPNGKRVMGILGAQAMATTVISDTRFSWEVPDHWTMEQAATVPVVYSTAFYALIVRGKLKRGEKVLVHSGSGGVGQAAICICLSMGCEVFTTVSSEEKKLFLQNRFPELKDDHFANSRTTDFEFKIMQITQGKGVDIVLNSLSEEKLQASLRCLGKHGRFLEIGKFDLSNDTPMGMGVFMKNSTVHGVLCDSLFNPYTEDWDITADLLREGIANGSVKPLPATVFDTNRVEEAFRFMAHGKHIGKVVMKIREEENEIHCLPRPITVKAVRRTLCNPQHVYLIVGGLGGIGLELAHWLFLRGGKKFVLTSRSGVKTGYQARCLNFWRKNGAKVTISNLDVSDFDQTVQLLREAEKLGPIGGIFNLAMVLRDCLFENQSAQNFREAAAPKYYGTRNLDKASRLICDSNLQWFVIFSSLSCGRGNAGQTNYGWANSTMERIIEQRRYDGLPGIGVQWGAVGDVGVILESMGDNSTVVGGSLPQRIASCMQSLDLFLCMNHPLVSSFIKSETHSKAGSSTDGDVVDAIAHILGVNDPSQLNADANLGDLGLDSLMGVEIKQALERDYDIVLSMKDIRTLTLSKLKAMAKGGPKKDKQEEDTVDMSSPDIAAQLANFEEQAALQRALIGGFRLRIDLDGLKPEKPCLKLNDVEQGAPVFFVHSIEGIGSTLVSLARELNYPVYCFQCTPDAPNDSMENLAKFYVEEMKKIQPRGPYRIIGYSYGACIGFEMAVRLQKLESVSSVESLTLLDGSYKYMSLYRQAYRRYYNVSNENLMNDALFETEILCGVIVRFVAADYKTIRSEFLSLPSIRERIERSVQMLMQTGQFKNKKIIEFALEAFWKKMMMADLYEPKEKFHGDITLVRAKIGAAREEDIGNDYGLGAIVTGKVDVNVVDGDHDSFIHGQSAEKTAIILTKCLENRRA